MEITIERDCKYTSDREYGQFVIMESGDQDYGSAVVLLRNLAERRDITSLEREALSTAIRVLRQDMDAKNP